VKVHFEVPNRFSPTSHYTQLQKCCPLDFSKKTKNFCEELETLKNFKKLS
jgi:hypothetical protein